jgi:hypothetical protein
MVTHNRGAANRLRFQFVERNGVVSKPIYRCAVAGPRNRRRRLEHYPLPLFYTDRRGWRRQCRECLTNVRQQRSLLHASRQISTDSGYRRSSVFQDPSRRSRCVHRPCELIATCARALWSDSDVLSAITKTAAAKMRRENPTRHALPMPSAAKRSLQIAWRDVNRR